MTKQRMNRKLLTMVVAVFALSMMLVSAAGAESATTSADANAAPSVSAKEPGALTTPPPGEVNTMGFGSGYKFLSTGYVSITPIGNGQVSVEAETIANQTVDKIGVYIYVERWTGSDWVPYNNRMLSNTNDSYISAIATFNVLNAYYYRARVIHFAYKGSVAEEATTTSGSVLAYK